MVPLLVAAGAISVFGKLQEGIFAKRAGSLANKEFNLQADTVLQQRGLDIEYNREMQSARRGSMRAMSARGGVDVDSGSAFELQLAQTRFDAITNSRMLFDAQLTARQLRFQGAQAKAAGKQAFQQSILSSFGSVANVMAVGAGANTAPIGAGSGVIAGPRQATGQF